VLNRRDDKAPRDYEDRSALARRRHLADHYHPGLRALSLSRTAGTAKVLRRRGLILGLATVDSDLRGDLGR